MSGRPSLPSIATTLAGILLIGLCSFAGYNELNFYRSLSLKAEGVVTNRWSQGLASADGDNYEIFRVEIQFIDEKTGKQITVYSDRETYEIGSKIPILYDPDNPTNFRIEGIRWVVWGVPEEFYHIVILFTLYIGAVFLFFGGRDWYTVHKTGHHYDKGLSVRSRIFFFSIFPVSIFILSIYLWLRSFIANMKVPMTPLFFVFLIFAVVSIAIFLFKIVADILKSYKQAHTQLNCGVCTRKNNTKG